MVDEKLSSQRLEIEHAIAVAKDAKRLVQLRHALTQSVAHSHYASLPPSDRQALDQLAAQRIAELRTLRLPKPQRKVADPADEPIPTPTPTPTLEQFDLGLFGGPDRLPHRPYCSDDLTHGVRVRGLAHALTKPYIQANPPSLRMWMLFDLDHEDSALWWERAGLVAPNWIARNRANGHAHLAFGLDAPVLVDSPDMRQAPMRYLCAVESAYMTALQADRGFSGLITKNPLHPLWQTLRGPSGFYSLEQLAAAVDLPKHMPRRRKPEEVGLGRNVTIFDWLRQYAYRQIRRYRGDVRNFVLWQSHLNNKALERNGEFRDPLIGAEIWHIVKSVAKWTWRRFDVEASDARFSALQSRRGQAGGKASGLARAAASEDKRASARLMAAQGRSSRDIASVLGVNQSTIVRWLGDA